MEQKMISEADIKKIVGAVMKEGLTYTAKHTGELKEENEDLKAQIEALKQDMEEVQSENANMRALIQTSLTIQNHADLQDDIEALKEQQQLARAANIAKEVAYKHDIGKLKEEIGYQQLAREKLKKDNKHLTEMEGRQKELIDTLQKSVKEGDKLIKTFEEKYNKMKAQYDRFVRETIRCWDWDLGGEGDATFGSNWGSMYINEKDAEDWSKKQVKEYFDNLLKLV
jgi:DNA repair exonuclease SbcCD ATPase subunit